LFERFQKRLVLLFVHEVGELGSIGQLELEEPTAAFGILVDLGGSAFELGIDGDHLARHRGIDLARGLDGLHDGDFLALAKTLPDRRKLDVYDVAKLSLGKVADADRARIAIDPDPFVILRVAYAGHADASDLPYGSGGCWIADSAAGWRRARRTPHHITNGASHGHSAAPPPHRGPPDLPPPALRPGAGV